MTKITESENLFSSLEIKRWNTNGLFSDHFLRNRLKLNKNLIPEKEIIDKIYEELKTLWKSKNIGLKNGNEETNRHEFINIILNWLGFSFFSNLDLPEQDRRQNPDYLLFESEEIKNRVFNQSLIEKYQSSISLLEAKRLDFPLDSLTEKNEKFPHQQIKDYLSNATNINGQPFFRWAILSNGNLWRLYCRESRPSSYFEFRLCDLDGELCSRDDFDLFIILFQSKVFIQQDNICLLDTIRNESINFQDQLEEKIRKRIAVVLEDLANGFWTNDENNIKDDDLKRLYNNCLIFLYRLLFVLYAEGKGLLPVDTFGRNINKEYRSRYSLQRLTSRITSSFYHLDELTDLYEEILKLFQLINGNHPRKNKACNVPRYNGGLFNPQLYPDLDNWRIGDRSLAKVLKDLMFTDGYVDNESRLNFTPTTIDYSDLEVRQLGDIYEGLLGGYLVLQNNKLRLLNEKGELHGSGSYYTPDWIVQFIIEKSLNPLINIIEGKEKIKKAVDLGYKNNAFAEEVLQLNILDNAMGSGHFLTRATEWLADKIVYHPTTNFHTKDSSSSQDHLEIAYWRRRIVEACIYGVDINPLAVELSKLSLWLTCIAINEPLNFLDHHLKVGNSLVGTKLKNINTHPTYLESEQYNLSLGIDFQESIAEAIKSIEFIERSESNNIDLVKGKESKWREKVVKILNPYKEIANLWMAIHYGIKIDESQYYLFAQKFLDSSKKIKKGKTINGIDDKITNIIREIEPFHWELEFPEVFYDGEGQSKANPGFDCIIGNPPYISTQTSSESYWRKILEKDFGFIDDLYVHFIYQNLNLLKKEGLLGYIVSDTFFTLTTKTSLRKELQKKHINYIVQCDPFKATVDASVLILENRDNITDYNLKFIQARYKKDYNTPEKDLMLFLKNENNLIYKEGANSYKIEEEKYQVAHSELNSLRIHETSNLLFRNCIKASFFEPVEKTIHLYDTLNKSLNTLLSLWWNKIENSKVFEKNKSIIWEYNNNLKPGDITLIGLICEGAQGMRTGDNGKYIGYLEGSKQADFISLRRKELVKNWQTDSSIKNDFKSLMEVYKNDIESVIDKLKIKFDPSKKLGLKRGEIYKIFPNENIVSENEMHICFNLRKDELENLWKESKYFSEYYKELNKNKKNNFNSIFTKLYKIALKNKIPMKELGIRNGEYYFDEIDSPRIATVHNGLSTKKCWLPFRKGDSEGNKWTDSESLFICWSKYFVDELRTSKQSRWQGFNYFLTEGVTYTLLGNHAPLKAKLQPKCIFDAGSSRLNPINKSISAFTLLTILNSDVFSYILKKFIKNTAAFEINDLRMAPFIIPSLEQNKMLNNLGEKAIEAKYYSLNSKEPSIQMINFAKGLINDLNNAPDYLRPSQSFLIGMADDCLNLIQSKINWEVEKLFLVEGKGPFDEF